MPARRDVRCAVGYLPFTTSSQSSAANLTMVKDQPLHPLLDGVNSLNGGSSSFHNSSITTAAGATLVAHWSNAQPLVGAKEALIKSVFRKCDPVLTVEITFH